MKNIVVYILCIGIVGGSLACKKEKSGVIIEKDDAQVSFELGDEKIDIAYPLDKPNAYRTYSFGGFSGNYFGIRSIFELDRNVNLQITLGTIASKNTSLSKEEFEQLIVPGKRSFGSLGSYSSYPEMKNGKVEIAFTDAELSRWCSTKILEKKTDRGLKVHVEVEQQGSDFTITNVEQVRMEDAKVYYRIKGNFDCMVYKVNSKVNKRLKGNFVGLLPLQNP